MNARSPIPSKVRLLVPVLASPHDGEVVGTARAIGRVLDSAGLGFHDLAAAIPTESDVDPIPAWDAAGWNAAARPTANPHAPIRRERSVFTEKQSARHRQMAVFCKNADRGRLTARERDFVNNVAFWRRDLSIAQADWLTDICDRLETEDRQQWQ